MATQVKGVRANKPNDSFGVTNNKNLYRGKYREDVYKDDEEEAKKLHRKIKKNPFYLDHFLLNPWQYLAE